MAGDDTDALYALDPDDFTAARDDLARRLRAGGDKAGAAAVKQLRRPSVAAWAVNQLARRHAADVAALLDAGERLRAAQAAAVAGQGAAAMRDATAARRAALAALSRHATRLLDETGRGDSHLPRVLATLEAATVDDDVAAAVRAGRVERESEPAGFGFGVLGDIVVPERPAPSREPAKPAAKPAKRVEPAEPAKPAKPAKRAAAEPGADKPAADKPAADKPAPRADTSGIERDLARAEREARKLDREATVAEREVERLRAKVANAIRDAKDRRTAARKAELTVDRLRQRLWEAGERER